MMSEDKPAAVAPPCLTGAMWIAGEAETGAGAPFHAMHAEGEALPPAYFSAAPDQVGKACAGAAEALGAYRDLPRERRAAFLLAIGEEITALGDALIDRAVAETALDAARLRNERDRTVNQLAMFADMLGSGRADGIRIAPADPARTSGPRPDIRLRRVALGPVAVFGASNFPLAFSVAGGDTAAALASGCPVIVKAHPAHPGTSELVGGAVVRAAARTGIPPGVFSLLFAAGHSVGAKLVIDPRIKAVAFTGSRRGGEALIKLAASRREPIPVFAEMGSVNPVVILPGALAGRPVDIGRSLAAAATLGAGQFCTSPGIVFAIEGPGYDAFRSAVADAFGSASAMAMLTPAMGTAFQQGVAKRSAIAGVTTLPGDRPVGEAGRHAPACHEVTLDTFMRNPQLAEELFGAAVVLVRCADAKSLKAAVAGLEGQLTASLHAAEQDDAMARDLLPLLEERAGRIVFNGLGTGVEVGEATVHGGPWPASSDSRSTSVGTLAIERFQRPIAYQNFPLWLLPSPLREVD